MKLLNQNPNSPTENHIPQKHTSYRLKQNLFAPERRQNYQPLWDKHGYTLPNSTKTQHSLTQPPDINTKEIFPGWLTTNQPLIVEIGAGTGISTIKMAQQEPEIFCIAVEIYIPGLLGMLTQIDQLELENLKLAQGDALELLNTFIPDHSLTGIRIFFPDPWPKAKHHKRRIISLANLTTFAQKLKPEGAIHIATDHHDYAQYIQENLTKHPDLTPCEAEEVPFLTDRPVTKFEARALKDPEHKNHEFFYKTTKY